MSMEAIGRRDAIKGEERDPTRGGQAHPESQNAREYAKGYDDEMRLQTLERQTRTNWLWICALCGSCLVLAVT